MQVQPYRRRGDCLRQQWQQHGQLALAAAAVLGWGLFLIERTRGRRRAGRSDSSGGGSKEARLALASHRVLRISNKPSTREEPAAAAAVSPAVAGAVPPAEVPPSAAAVERAELHEALVSRLGQIRQGVEASSACTQHDSSTGTGRVSAALLLVREEVQLMDLASELEALRAQLNTDVLHQAQAALSVGGTTASSRSCSGLLPAAVSDDAAGAAAAQGVADGEAAASALELSAAGSSSTRSPDSGQQELDLEQPWMHVDACSIGDPTCMVTFQQRLSPLLLRRSISRLSEPPASPPLHASLQPSPEGESSELAEEESWLLGSEPEAADAAGTAGAPAAAASVLPLDEMLLGSPRAPPAVVSASPTVPAGPMSAQEQQQERWSPKATVASLADLRHSTPSSLVICQRTTASFTPGSSTTRRSKSAAASAEGLSPPLSARMLRQSASLGGKKPSSVAPVQGQPLLAAAARKAAAAVTPMAAVRSSIGSASIASVRSGMSTPSTSSRPNSARLLPGEEAPGSSSRIPKPISGWSPSSTPSSRIPRPRQS